jgi:hypothetical protein
MGTMNEHGDNLFYNTTRHSRRSCCAWRGGGEKEEENEVKRLNAVSSSVSVRNVPYVTSTECIFNFVYQV